MNRFTLAAALAVGSLGFAGTADAQFYNYNYYGVNPYNGSIYNKRGLVTPFAAQGYTNYVNPYTGAYGGRSLYQNAWGTNLYQSGGYNPYFGRGYSNNFYRPAAGFSPYYSRYRFGY